MIVSRQNMLLKKKILKTILKSSSSEKRKLETNGNSTRVFHGQYKNETNSSNIEPREVYVPYTPFRRDRFYDWPPSPAVSRATPLNFSNLASNSGAMDNILESMLIEKQENGHDH